MAGERDSAIRRVLVLLLAGSYCWHEGESSSLPDLDFSYHNHTELTKYLKQVAAAHPSITNLYDIGKSIKERELWVLEITAAPKNRIGIPNVKIVGNIHGNEPVGKEVVLHLIQFLVSNYPSNESVAWLLNNTRIHFLPCMNPDGFEKAVEGHCRGDLGRMNKKSFDLNRNFPDAFHPNTIPPQVERNNVMKWMDSTTFVLSAGLHGGALVANYPYDNVGPHSTRQAYEKSLTPDNDVLQYLASSYANTHPRMHRGLPCEESERNFTSGITNGAEWFPSPGGMSDYNYAYHGCLELTLEIGCCKYPTRDKLPQFWKENKEALLEYIGQVHLGVRGILLDNVTNAPISEATLQIDGRNNTFNSTHRGEFWRILLPGEYILKVNKNGYPPMSVPFRVVAPVDAQRLNATWLEVHLSTNPSPRLPPITHYQTTTMSWPTTESIVVDDHKANTTPMTTTTPRTQDVHLEVNLEQVESLTVKQVLSNTCERSYDTTIIRVVASCLALTFYMHVCCRTCP